jgi:hypothetical protein
MCPRLLLLLLLLLRFKSVAPRPRYNTEKTTAILTSILTPGVSSQRRRQIATTCSSTAQEQHSERKKDEEKIGAKTQERPQKEPENRESVKERCIPVANKFATKKHTKRKEKFTIFFGWRILAILRNCFFKNKGIFCRKFPSLFWENKSPFLKIN